MPGLSIFFGRRSVSAHAWAGPVEAVDQFGRGGLFDSAAMIDRLNRVRYAASNTETPNCTDLIVVPALKFREANFVLPKQPPDREPAIGEGVFGAAADEIAAASLVGQHKSAEGAKTNWHRWIIAEPIDLLPMRLGPTAVEVGQQRRSYHVAETGTYGPRPIILLLTGKREGSTTSAEKRIISLDV